MYKRILNLSLSDQETCFLWGPRQTGKSTLLRQLFPGARTYDLLLSREYQRLVRNPGILREECLADDTLRQMKAPPVIIDEVQKVPGLLDEVHLLIENAGIRFVLLDGEPHPGWKWTSFWVNAKPPSRSNRAKW